MYAELIKRLRNRRICIQQSGGLDDFPLLREAADAIEELQKNRVCRIVEKDGETELFIENRWIPVAERLPEEDVLGTMVLCVLKRKDLTWVDIRFFMGGKFHHPKKQKGKVTHWQPLPEPPKEET